MFSDSFVCSSFSLLCRCLAPSLDSLLLLRFTLFRLSVSLPFCVSFLFHVFVVFSVCQHLYVRLWPFLFLPRSLSLSLALCRSISLSLSLLVSSCCIMVSGLRKIPGAPFLPSEPQGLSFRLPEILGLHFEPDRLEGFILCFQRLRRFWDSISGCQNFQGFISGFQRLWGYIPGL